MAILAIISVGVLFGTFLSFDLCISPKKQGAFTRHFLYLVVASVPAVYQFLLNISGKKNFEPLASLWFKYFYVSFAVAIFICFLFFYVYIYKKIVNGAIVEDRKFTYFDFILKGYYLFSEEVNNVNIKNDNENYIFKIQKRLQKRFMIYINEIYNSKKENFKSMNDYLDSIVTPFIHEFVGMSNSRITISQIDSKSNKMQIIFTTESNYIEGEISIFFKKIIIESARLETPIICSTASEKKYYKINSSVRINMYDNFVICALNSDVTEVPLYVICWEVKGEYTILKMKAIVQSLFFEIMCKKIYSNIVLID